MNSALTLDQILRAAQLLEQNQLMDPLSFCKLGQEYEERFTQSKMRTNLIAPAPVFDHSSHGGGLATAAAAGSRHFEPSAGSTGSSRRSSPSSLLSAASPNSSGPNSPPVILLPSNINAAAAFVAASKKSSCASSTGIAPLLTCRSSAASTHSMGSTRQSRVAHNELEKNRRAKLRNYLDKLKSVLPADPESTRDTTLSLLTRARNYIRAIKRQKQTLLVVRDDAAAENLRLQERLAALKQREEMTVEEEHELDIPLNQSALEAQQQLVNLQLTEDSLIAAPQINIQTSVLPHQPPMLCKPEPQHVSNSSPMYMEFSPSAKPAPVPAGLPPALSALLPQLAAALQQQQQTHLFNNNPEVLSSIAALLQSRGSLLNGSSAPSTQTSPMINGNLLYTPFRSTPIDLINEGLLPALPLLYPYPYLCEQRHPQLMQSSSTNA